MCTVVAPPTTSPKLVPPLIAIAAKHPATSPSAPSTQTFVAPHDGTSQVSVASQKTPYTRVNVVLEGVKISEPLLASAPPMSSLKPPPPVAPCGCPPQQSSADGDTSNVAAMDSLPHVSLVKIHGYNTHVNHPCSGGIMLNQSQKKTI